MSTEVLMIIASPSFILSGFTWPLSQMPAAARTIANMIPLTHYVIGFRKLAYMQATLGDLKPEIIGLLIITGVAMLITYIMLKLKIIAVLKRYKLAKVIFPIHKLKGTSKLHKTHRSKN